MGQLEHAFECGKRGERLTRCAFMLAAVADAKSSGLLWTALEWAAAALHQAKRVRAVLSRIGYPC